MTLEHFLISISDHPDIWKMTSEAMQVGVSDHL